MFGWRYISVSKFGVILGIAFLFTLIILSFRTDRNNFSPDQNPASHGRIPIAVLGDSDSHSYRDAHYGMRRGGDYHSVTFQWTEILARLRSSEIELGEFGYWGTRGIIHNIRGAFGLDARTPRKQDYEYNFAFSGASCEELAPHSWQQQSVQLRKLMDRDPEYWRDGLVIIRIGVNDFGQWPKLKTYLRGVINEPIRQPITDCIKHVGDAVKRIRQKYPSVKIALVGIFDNSNWLAEEMDKSGHDNVNKVLDIFDHGLMKLANNDPYTMFVEDRNWYSQLLGRWGAGGYIGTRTYSLGGPRSIRNTLGDHPANIGLADKHAGTVFNGLWIRHLFSHLNQYFGLGITPLLDSEIADLADPTGTQGLAPEIPQNRGAPTLLLTETPLVLGVEEIDEFRFKFKASDSSGNDISATATGFLQSGSGEKRWLFGQGSQLWMSKDRHPAGLYTLQLQVQDRFQQQAIARVAIRIKN